MIWHHIKFPLPRVLTFQNLRSGQIESGNFRDFVWHSEKSSENQLNTLMYTMGDVSNDIVTSFGLTKEEKKTYDTVVAKFQSHFVKKRNIIFEHTKFNQRKQEEGESVDDSVTTSYCLSEHCQYVLNYVTR